MHLKDVLEISNNYHYKVIEPYMGSRVVAFLPVIPLEYEA